MTISPQTITWRSLLLVFFLVSCSAPSGPIPAPPKTEASPPEGTQAVDLPTPQPPRILTICLGREPASLFLYGDSSTAARNIRQAIYDGPLDLLGFEFHPVILQKVPALENGDARLLPVRVKPGERVVDAAGSLTTLAEGTTYLPAGCSDGSCAKTFTGKDPITMTQLAVTFHLLPDLRWSDGAPLTSDDSLYSYEVARNLYPRGRGDLVAHTQSYLVLDPGSVEWRGVPGYHDPLYPANFFSPLPRHAWGNLTAAALLSATASTRDPLGWGPYKIDEWKAGDHITLSKNTAYFRASEGLPHFDNLVFRFMPDVSEALAALEAGECDYLDETALANVPTAKWLELKDSGSVAIFTEPGTAWEHLDFNLQPYNGPNPPGVKQNSPAAVPQSIFQKKEVRQALAMCIDRPGLVQELFAGQVQALDTYTQPENPLVNKDARHYDYDPASAAALLQSAGWIDTDNNPATPRLSAGVPGIADGTPLEFPYLIPSDEQHQQAAKIIQASLGKCGVKMDVQAVDVQALFAPGPGGPIFGRGFSAAQFAWAGSQDAWGSVLQPPCWLYLSSEIPGPYPDFPKGWGGANASGYSSADFDAACRQAMTSLPDTPAYAEAHRRAQAIFAEDLPVIPLYQHLKVVAARSDMCNIKIDPSADTGLWNLEMFAYGDGCK